MAPPGPTVQLGPYSPPYIGHSNDTILTILRYYILVSAALGTLGHMGSGRFPDRWGTASCDVAHIATVPHAEVTARRRGEVTRL